MTTRHRILSLSFSGTRASFFALTISLFFSNSAIASDYSTPFRHLSTKETFDFHLGEALFQKFWVASPSSTTASDGLGPVYNARSCNSCHQNNGRGHAPQALSSGASVPSFFVRLGQIHNSKNTDGIYPKKGDDMYGHQFQTLSSAGIKPEGNYTLTYDEHTETLADGTEVVLRKPELHWSQLNYGPFAKDTGFSMRVSPPLVGMGLLDAASESVILSNADPDDIDRDGISGKANWIIDSHIEQNQKHAQDQKKLGRFGYKATVVSVNTQNQMAFNGDMGLSTPMQPNPSGDCTAKQIDCLNSPNGNSPHLENLEVDSQQVNLVNLFVSLSAPPAMRHLDKPFFLKGKKVFDNLGCASCHTPKMTTDTSSPYKVLHNRTFYPFTDMLLHDMGPGLASDFPEFSAEPSEWRTSPLWGIGLSKTVSGRIGFLHDGRANTLEEAILWHGGEAQASKLAYKQLNQHDRNLLIKFLESL